MEEGTEASGGLEVRGALEWSLGAMLGTGPSCTANGRGGPGELVGRIPFGIPGPRVLRESTSGEKLQVSFQEATAKNKNKNKIN